MSEGVACAGCKKSLLPAETLYATDGRPVCQACFDKLDLAATMNRGQWTLPGIAAACGLAPFFFSVSSSSSINGEVVSYTDPFAIAGGAACAILAIVALLKARKSTALNKSTLMLVPVLLVILGAIQLARGFGKL